MLSYSYDNHMKISKKILNTLSALETLLKKTPAEWAGREAILEMKNAGYSHWRQMEWIGFYFQFLCEKELSGTMQIPGPKYGRVEFDGFCEIPWDFKVHPTKNPKGQDNKSVIINDRIATLHAIEEYGVAGLILATGEAVYNDQDRSFQLWHKELKGGLSKYEEERILRKAHSRLRKTAFKLETIDLILLDKEKVNRTTSFQEDFRNSDGSLRKAKVLLSLADITPEMSIQMNSVSSFKK